MTKTITPESITGTLVYAGEPAPFPTPSPTGGPTAWGVLRYVHGLGVGLVIAARESGEILVDAHWAGADPALVTRAVTAYLAECAEGAMATDYLFFRDAVVTEALVVHFRGDLEDYLAPFGAEVLDVTAHVVEG